MPSGRSPPPGFGIVTRRTGSGRYVFETSSSRKPASHASTPDASICCEGHPVHARRTRIGAGQRVGVAQNVLATNLVVEHVEAESRLRLRLAIQLSLKGPDLSQVLQGSSPITLTSPSSKAHQKSGSFPPPALPGLNARTTLSDSRPGRRLTATLRPRPSPRTGLPRLPASPFQRAVSTTPADRAGACVDCFPARAAFPEWQEGRHPHCHFRGLLRLHSRYGPLGLLNRPRRPLSRGSGPAGYPAEPLVSYQINRQLSGWNLPPLVIRAFGAHCQNQTFLEDSPSCNITQRQPASDGSAASEAIRPSECSPIKQHLRT